MGLPNRGMGQSQTFDVGGSSSSNKQTSGKPTSGQTGNDFSWGAGIEVARQARAADEALKRNDYASAVAFAQQAAKSAPQDAELWFLLGYAARLDEKYQTLHGSFIFGCQGRICVRVSAR